MKIQYFMCPINYDGASYEVCLQLAQQEGAILIAFYKKNSIKYCILYFDNFSRYVSDSSSNPYTDKLSEIYPCTIVKDFSGKL